MRTVKVEQERALAQQHVTLAQQLSYRLTHFELIVIMPYSSRSSARYGRQRQCWER